MLHDFVSKNALTSPERFKRRSLVIESVSDSPETFQTCVCPFDDIPFLSFQLVVHIQP